MRKIPSKMHMHDMVTIDTIVLEIVGGAFNSLPPPGSLTFSNTPDRIRFTLLYFPSNSCYVPYVTMIWQK